LSERSDEIPEREVFLNGIVRAKRANPEERGILERNCVSEATKSRGERNSRTELRERSDEIPRREVFLNGIVRVKRANPEEREVFLNGIVRVKRANPEEREGFLNGIV
jgi:hypothetical protein